MPESPDANSAPRPSPWTEPGDYIVPVCPDCGSRHETDEPCVVEMQAVSFRASFAPDLLELLIELFLDHQDGRLTFVGTHDGSWIAVDTDTAVRIRAAIAKARAEPAAERAPTQTAMATPVRPAGEREPSMPLVHDDESFSGPESSYDLEGDEELVTIDVFLRVEQEATVTKAIRIEKVFQGRVERLFFVCPYCDTEIGVRDRFCRECGERMIGGESDVV